MRRFLTALTAVLILAALAGAGPPSRSTPRRSGSGGAVASDTPQATNAGLEVLRHGGNAADAAVAVASTLGVTDPLVAGIGGGGYFVYYDASTAPRLHDRRARDGARVGRTRTCSSTRPRASRSPFPTAVTSGLSVGVPGTLMTWQRAPSDGDA